MSEPVQRELSEEARSLLSAFKAEETPAVSQQEQVWSAVSKPRVTRRLRTVESSTEAVEPQTTPGRSVWIAAAVAAAAVLAFAFARTRPDRATEVESDAPLTAPYEAEPMGVAGGAAREGETSMRPRLEQAVPAPVPPLVDEPGTIEVADPSPTPPGVQKPLALEGPDAKAEVILIVRAKRAMAGGSPGKAVRLLRKGAKSFRPGQLGHEREVLLVEALCAAGRTEDACSTADRLLASSPEHPYAGRLRAACAGQDNHK